MSKKLDISSAYKKSYKKYKKSGILKSNNLLDDCINDLLDGKYLPDTHPEVKDHKCRHLIDGQQYREFHPTNRLCVLYQIKDDSIYLKNIGTHKELGLAENLN